MGLDGQHRVEVLAQQDQLEVVVDGGFLHSGLEVAVLLKVQQMEDGVADQAVAEVVSVQHLIHHSCDRC